MLFHRRKTVRRRFQKARPAFRARLSLEGLERRDLPAAPAGFGSLVQVSGTTPFTNTSDIAGQSGTVYLNSEVEPMIAADPTNPLHMVAVWQQDRWSNGGCRGIVSGVTTDGGATWTDVPLPGSSVNAGGTTLRASDPWVSIGPDGTVYADYLAVNDPNVHNPLGVLVNTSTDGGFHWSNPVTVINNNGNDAFFNDKDSVTADPTRPGYAYAVWDRLNSGGDPTQGPGPTLFSRTTDGGHTWSAPADILDPANGQTIGNIVTVLPNGTLIDCCVSIDYNTNANTVVVIRSTDGGNTWSAPITVNDIESVGVSDPDNGTGIREGNGLPAVAVDHTSGALYITWGDGRFSNFSHDDIAICQSTDGGLTWSAPGKVNLTPTNIPTADQQAFTPAVAVAANGTVAVSYYDFRFNTPSAGASTDAWIAFSHPGATLSFTNEQRQTNSSFDIELAPNAYGLFLGDYGGLTAGGANGNTFGTFFGTTVSSQDPTSMFFSGAIPFTLTWTGRGATANWSDPNNWNGSAAPAAGLNLLFGPGASKLSNTNDLVAGTSFGSVTFGSAGYSIGGNAITLTGNLDGSAATGNNAFNLPITLGAADSVLTGGAGTDLTLGGAISDGGLTLSVGGGAGRVDFIGAIGGSGGLTVNDAGGTAALSGPPDTYTGATTVQAGTLLLSKATNAVAGPLNVAGGVVRELAGNQIADTAAVSVTSSGLLDLSNNSDVVGALTLDNGSVATGTGTLTLGGNVTNTGTSSVSGNVALGGANRTITATSSSSLTVSAVVSGATGLVKTGPGTVTLAAANTYTGGTTLMAGTLGVGNNSALGTGTLTVSSGMLAGTGAGQTLANPVTLNGTMTVTGNSPVTLSGPVTLTANRTLNTTNTALTTVGGVIGQSGGAWQLTKGGGGQLLLQASNTYTGGTLMNGGTLIVGNNGALGTGTLTMAFGTIKANTGPISLANALNLNGNFTVAGTQNLTFMGPTTLTGTRTVTVTNTGLTTFAGNIGQSAAGLGLTKAGAGTLVLSGTNSYTGTTTAKAGTLIVNGSQAGSPVSVSGGATLAGSGTVGTVTAAANGHVVPGPAAGQTGILTAAGVTLPSGSSLNLTLNGTTPGTGYSQLSASGTVNVTGSTLSLTFGFTPGVGTSFTLINNTGVGAVVGTFKGLAQNATFTQNGMVFQISYTGGSGNDVVITRIA